MNTVHDGRLSAPVPARAAAPNRSATELLARVALGDERAFAALYDSQCAAVYGLVHRVLNDSAQAEEVARAVWVRVWRSATRYPPGRDSGTAWVMALAHRHAVERLRSIRPVPADDPAVSGTGDPPSGQAADAANPTTENSAVRLCLEPLTAPQRQAVLMAYYQGRTCEEIGAALDAPKTTVATRIRGALRRLRDQPYSIGTAHPAHTAATSAGHGSDSSTRGE